MQNPAVLMIAALAVPAFAFALLIVAFIVKKRQLARPYCPHCGETLPEPAFGESPQENCPACLRNLAGDEDGDMDEKPENGA